MPPEDAAYIWDMRDAALEIADLFFDVTRPDFERNRALRLAAERLPVNIGEAARLVSDRYRGEHPEIPWRKIVAQRNVLVHEYGKIRSDLIWLVIQTTFPCFSGSLKPSCRQK